jgi:uncharacterized protein
MIKKELLDILCCPSCKGDLKFDEKKNSLICISCGKSYEVKDGIPIMLDDNNGK